MAQQIRVRQRSTGLTGTMVRGDPNSFIPDQQMEVKRFNPFQEYQQLEQYSPILKSAPYLFGEQGGEATVGGAKTLGTTGKFLFSPKFRVGMAQGARQALEEVGSGAGRALETELSQMKGTVNIRPIIQKFVDRFKDEGLQQSLGQAIAKAQSMGDETLAQFLNKPSLAEKASVLDAHKVAISLEQIPEVNKVVTLLRSSVKQKGRKFVQKATPEVLDLMGQAKAIRGEIEKVAGSAFQNARTAFGKTAHDVESLTPMFSERQGVWNIMTGFGGPFKGAEVRGQVARTLPGSMAQQLARVPRGLAALGVAGVVAGHKFLKPLFEHRSSDISQ